MSLCQKNINDQNSDSKAKELLQLEQLTESLINVKIKSDQTSTGQINNNGQCKCDQTNSSKRTSISSLLSTKDQNNGSVSKLPICTVNGRPTSYKQPSQKNQQQSLNLQTFSNINRCESFVNSGLVPSVVSSVHNSHLAFCPNMKANNPNNNSSSTSSEVLSISNIPNQFINRNNNRKQSKSKSNNEKFRFEEYMPLCEVQRLLGKGEIVEGILRINQKNFEDAYISAPDGEIDINIYGRENINRAFNGDRVAVKLYPIFKWKILYDMVDKFWDTWQQEILDYLNENKKKDKSIMETEQMLSYTDLEQNSTNTCIDLKKYANISPDVQTLSPEDFSKFSFSKMCLQKRGQVVYIFNQVSRTFGGRIQPGLHSNNPYAVFSPINSKISRALISLNQLPKDFSSHPHRYEKCLFLAEFFSWPALSRMPFAKIKRIIGQAGNVESETDLLLTENCVEFDPFPDNIDFHLPKLETNGQYKLSEKEILKRMDLRKECVFTIDPITARDLDDALSIKHLGMDEKTGNELFEVGVHIADVAYFVKQNDPVDLIAQQRTTSFYCVQKVVPMLPHILCQNLCSLNPGEDKFAFSVFWHMDGKGQILKTWFAKTVIQSCVKLSYELAYDFISEPNKDWSTIEGLPKVYGKHNYTEIIKSLEMLNQLALVLRRKRFQNGAIEFKKSVVKFMLNETFEHVLGFVSEDKKSGYIVEEFMLLANITVAEKLYKHYSENAVLRRHDRPDTKQLVDLQNSCNKCDFDLKITSSKALQQSLERLQAELPSKVCEAISFRLLRSMKQAQYFIPGESCSSTHHFGLGIPLYTHFTSPIRRYPDILVHRQLEAILGLGKAPQFAKDEFLILIERCNLKKIASRIVSETSIKLFLSIYIRKLGSLDFDAIVITVMDHSFECFIPSLNFTVQVYCDQLGLDSFNFNGKQSFLDLVILSENKKKRRISLYDEVRLRVSVPKDEEPYKWKAVLAD